jgi:hypothetical protein
MAARPNVPGDAAQPRARARAGGSEHADRRLLAELHAHRPARGSRVWIQEAMTRRGSNALPGTMDRMLREMRQEGCSICGENPRAHRHETHMKEEHRPGEPCIVGFEGSERVAADCPYCGAARGPLDEGWVPADLPRRVYAECCGGGWYEIVARKRTPSKSAPPGGRAGRARA